MQDLENTIKNAIRQVNERIQKHPLAFLTESDIQCHIYSELLPVYGGFEPISNTSVWGADCSKPLKPMQTSRLHSELLLSEGRIDLAVLDLCATRFAFNSKGRFGHVQLDHGEHAFIEIKVSRTHRSNISSKARWLKLLRADIEKLRRYSWLSFLLAYDFDLQLAQNEIDALSEFAGPFTRVLYFKNQLGVSYLQK